VIAQLIGVYLDTGIPLLDAGKHSDNSLRKSTLVLPVAVKKTLGRLEGTWGLVIISKDEPDKIIAVGSL
jgi:glucosamine 6-phosphate synthetase-like amidotransferase/phosphosugar isomerase protein